MSRYRSAVCLSLSLLVVPAFGQNVDIEALAGLQFNFGNPGARALGMGGAFLGLADDASAAEANPAGLTILRTPEISIEGRNFEAIQFFNTTGVFPDIEREGFSAYSDPVQLAFASFVYPMGNGAFAAYYHEPINFEGQFNALTTQFLGFPQFRDAPRFFQPQGDPPGSAGPVTEEACIEIINQTGDPFSCLQYQQFPFVTDVQIKLKTAGLAYAHQFGSFSLGASVRYQEFEEFASTFRVAIDNFGNAQLIQQLAQATVSGDDLGKQDDLTFSAGFKWQLVDNFSVGGVYKQGAEYDTATFVDNLDGAGFQVAGDPKFHIPDVYGVGVSWRPTPVFTINADVVEVGYSNLTEDFQSIYTEAQVLGQGAYQTKDATEYHIGAEYFFIGAIPVAIRAGYWHDPAHGLEYVGPRTCTDEVFNENDRPFCAANRTVLSILFPGSEDQDHYSIGIGLAWPNFQIDAAYDTSDTFKVGSLSAVYRF